MNQDFFSEKEWNEIRYKYYMPILKEIENSTICFYTDHLKKIYTVAGTGVFIKFRKDYYVVSAAHVLDGYLNTTYVIINDPFILRGDLIISKIPAGGARQDDKIDLLIIKLEQKSLQFLLKQYVPIEISEFQDEHHLLPYSVYLTFGYPITRTKTIWRKDEIESTGVANLSCLALDFSYEKFGFQKDKHIALLYEKANKTIQNTITHLGPNPKGISGGGLWYAFEGKITLLAIIVERIHQVNDKVIVCTKMKEVLALIC